MKATQARVPADVRAEPDALAACPLVPASRLPGCDTGAGARLTFVMAELADIVQELIAGRRSR